MGSSAIFHNMRVGLTLAPLAVLTFPVWAQQLEIPVACDEAGEPVELVYGSHTTGCEISPATDLDQFSFFGSAGEKIRISVLSGSLLFDPRLEIRDPEGILIEDVFCSGGSNATNDLRCAFSTEPEDFSVVSAATLTKTGIYFMALSDEASNEPGAYTLELERLPPDPAPPDIVYNVAQIDSVSPATDMDFYTFHGVEGTIIRITVLSTSLLFDPRLEVWDPDGILLEDTFCSGGSNATNDLMCSFSVEPPDFSVVPSATLTRTGAYVIALSDQGTNESGGYDVNLQCLFGPCPAAADLVLTMTDSTDPVDAGSGLEYLVTVTNNGPGDAQAVTVSTMLPPEVAFEFTTGCGEDPDGIPDCSLGEIPSGDSAQFEVAVTVNPDANGTITNVATVDALTSENSAGDEMAIESTEVLGNDLIFADDFEVQIKDPPE